MIAVLWEKKKRTGNHIFVNRNTIAAAVVEKFWISARTICVHNIRGGGKTLWDISAAGKRAFVYYFVYTRVGR